MRPGRVRAVAVLTLFVLLTFLLAPLQALLVRFAPGAAGRLGCAYWRCVARLIAIRVTITGAPEPGGALIAANHSSWLDIVVLGSIAPTVFVAKREVAGWPLFGLIARLGRTVFVDRARRSAVSGALEEIRARLKAGDKVVLFAEGTSSDGNRVLPFRTSLMGAAEVTIDGRPAPVQPVTVAYRALYGIPLDRWRMPQIAWYGDMALWPHLLGALGLGPIDAEAIFHPARTMAEAGDRKALAGSCEAAVRAGLTPPRPPAPPRA